MSDTTVRIPQTTIGQAIDVWFDVTPEQAAALIRSLASKLAEGADSIPMSVRMFDQRDFVAEATQGEVRVGVRNEMFPCSGVVVDCEIKTPQS